uniref:NADH-ubiquinone oxidoreductase chain 2 n=1 Tax=Pseudogymnoascus pannorum TaxID=79858 RepID=A0A0U2D754_9PEZI|nr:NADH dehydrogenase subunit 2 [Pseudogymnoascus pannorum]AKM70291.1 NADH dehydrogenase subunit 2 [Pseudogymnoascus pannorum]
MLILSLISLLMSNAVSLRRDKSILYSRITIIILLLSSYLTLDSLYITNLDTGIGLYGGLFSATSITHTFQLFIFLVSAAILQLTSFYPRKVFFKNSSKLLSYNAINFKSKILNKMGEQFKIIEYPLIILFIITGAVFLVSTSDLVSIFLSIELQSYGLYLLSTIYRNSEQATSGGLTYFLLGGLASCFILLGSALLYANSGTTSLDGIYVIASISDLGSDISNNTQSWYKPDYINMSLLILCVGFLFKISAAPFHFWSPDVYDAVPTIVTTFIAIIAKISIFIFFLELVHYTSNSLFTNNFSWTTSLLVSSLLSLIIGSVLGLTQFRIKRLFAYSTISHVGFILLALSINSIESIQAFIFYLMQYSLSNLNAFMLLLAIGYSLYCYSNENKKYSFLLDKNNSPIQLISQMKGFFYINPMLALSLAITLFSFAGIPPLIGFFAKQMVLSAALDNGYVFLTLVAILTSVISAVYYLNIVKEIFFDKPEYKVNPYISDVDMYATITKKNGLVQKLSFKYDSIILSSHLTITISILTLIILLFIFMPQESLSMSNILALILFNS